MLKIAFVYQFCTFGGVERIFLNRLLAFKLYNIDAKVDIIYLSGTGGAYWKFKECLRRNNIDANVFIENNPDFRGYDLVFVIDSPQVHPYFEERKIPFIVECHTSYKEMRQYIKDVKEPCITVVVPTEYFKDIVKNELTVDIPIFVLRNFIISDNLEINYSEIPNWKLRPVFYLGRMDYLKDPYTLMEGFSILNKKYPDNYFLLLCGPVMDSVNLEKETKRLKILNRLVYFPPMPFYSTFKLMDIIKQNKGVFVSASKGESFGYSSAEAICAGLPVVLSDIRPHLELLGELSQWMTFRVGQPQSLAERLEFVMSNWDFLSKELEKLRNKFSAEYFIEDWKNLMNFLLKQQ